jgi:hypothetical protein
MAAELAAVKVKAGSVVLVPLMVALLALVGMSAVDSPLGEIAPLALKG